MIKRLIFMIAVLMAIVACEQNNSVKVVYNITDSDSGFEVNYRTENGDLINESIVTQSESDVWRYEFIGEKGDIVFVSAIYYDSESKLKVQIMMDGKVYKEGYSKHDTTNYLVVSGTVPY